MTSMALQYRLAQREQPIITSGGIDFSYIIDAICRKFKHKVDVNIDYNSRGYMEILITFKRTGNTYKVPYDRLRELDGVNNITEHFFKRVMCVASL